MHPRLYRLIEAHQRIDRTLRSELERPRPDGLRLMRPKAGLAGAGVRLTGRSAR